MIDGTPNEADASGCYEGVTRMLWGIGGWLSATGQGLDFPTSVGRSWWSVGALVRAGAHFGGGFALELEAGATVPLVERRFTITTPERTVGETPTVAPVVTLGLSRAL